MRLRDKDVQLLVGKRVEAIRGSFRAVGSLTRAKKRGLLCSLFGPSWRLTIYTAWGETYYFVIWADSHLQGLG
jgi:hypothetical protein